MSLKRFLSDKDISFALNYGAVSEDDLDFDNDSLVDPGFVPELDTFENEASELDINVDSIILIIIETLENTDENPFSSIETIPSNESTAGLS